MIYIEMDKEAVQCHLVYVSKKGANKGQPLKFNLYKKFWYYYKLSFDASKTVEDREFSKSVSKVYEYLFKNIERIAIAKLDEIELIQEEYDTLITHVFTNEAKHKVEGILNELQKFFENEYERFGNGYLINFDGEIIRWNAYAYVKKLKVNVCPYCNAQFTLTIEPGESPRESGKVRAELDHFISKSSYPIFGMSIYNLVPSCKVCNQSLKHEKETSLMTHFNPFDVNIQGQFKVSRQFKQRKSNISYVDSILGEENEIEITILPSKLGYPYIRDLEQREFNRKVNNNVKMFRLKAVYNQHKEFIQENILKARIYNEIYLNQLEFDFPLIIRNENDLKTLLIKPSIEFTNSILSKALSDILNEEIFINKK
ncbi:hypothetical protein KHU47_01745 [Bacillus cereus]|uniref:hypothetical protein n=1 Tax=Bacillus cereus TaxID=1396 RepID=UPI001BDB0E76|nr:hypothetical protein [Bacillus cereus]MBT0788172.1 hypothetical protein [Bacillus cereus]